MRRKFIYLSVLSLVLSGFTVGDRVVLNYNYKGRSWKNFYDSAGNVVAYLDKGTIGIIDDRRKLPSGNYGYFITVVSGKEKNKKVWIYDWRDRDDDILLCRDQACAETTSDRAQAQALKTQRTISVYAREESLKAVDKNLTQKKTAATKKEAPKKAAAPIAQTKAATVAPTKPSNIAPKKAAASTTETRTGSVPAIGVPAQSVTHNSRAANTAPARSDAPVLAQTKAPAVLSKDVNSRANNPAENIEQVLRPYQTNNLEKPYCAAEEPRITTGKYCPNLDKECNHNADTMGFPKEARDGYKNFIYETTLKIAKVAKLNPTLLLAIMRTDSNFNPFSVNTDDPNGGSFGIGQFQLATAQSALSRLYQATPNHTGSRPRITTKRPLGCEKARDTNFSRECFESLKNCATSDDYKNSVYCPETAIKLMALNLIGVREDRQIPRSELVGDDAVAEARLFASAHNSGYVGIKKAKEYNKTHSNKLTMRHYGELFGGKLSSRPIHQCFMYRATGICGGTQGTLMSYYRGELCASSEQRLTRNSQIRGAR